MNSNSPNFGAGLLHKNGYGYDVSGDVTDGGQTNIRDVNYRGVQPNPQESTPDRRHKPQPPNEKPLSDGVLLYVGTTKKAWEEQTDQVILFNSSKDALTQAHQTAESGTYQDPGLITDQGQPMVLCIKFKQLKGFQLGPDPNTGFDSWRESFDHNGSFVLVGSLDRLKSKFKLITL